MINLSVIIPVYNVEVYLDKCLMSVVNQTFKNMEIIIVDDGSTDSSGKKCDEWATKDSRIKVYHKTNGGLMSAWKYGLLRASGEYIAFVDSDDWLDLDAYELLLSHKEIDRADLIMFGFIKDGRDIRKERCTVPNAVYDRDAIVSKIYPNMIRTYNCATRGLNPSRWSKIYKKELLLGILDYCDEQVSIGEDLLTTFAVMSKVNCLVSIDCIPYHYRMDNQSMTRSYSDSKYEKINKLKNAMERVALELYTYNFVEQLAADYIALIIEQVEQEILYSTKGYKAVKNSIKSRTDNPLFRNALSKLDTSRFSKKLKIYLFLIRYRFFNTLIFFRKLKKVR